MVETQLDNQFVDRLRRREPLIGYWVATDNPVATERIASVGYDYVCLDMQHGLIGYAGMVSNVIATDAGGSSSVVRVGANDAGLIGRALDAGARAVIVPLVNTAAEAAAAVAACRYQPGGIRSYGPSRAPLRVGAGDVASIDAAVACIVMIETAQGLANVEPICSTPGLDGVYVGPSDLSIALGAPRAGAVADIPAFDEGLRAIRAAADQAGIACGMHCPDGETAARRLAEGFTYASISSDLLHLEAVARTHLAAARA
jgi:4-hydroxy-2-oxoheptanedioate aldolase